MGKDISSAVREVCLSFPETVEVPSRGSPDFRVRGKTFATYMINLHGDGKVALWLHAGDGVQQFYVDMEPEYYYVPPYVGPKGWLGVELNKGLSWHSVAKRVREAYEGIAPKPLLADIGETIAIEPPDIAMKPEEINLFLAKRGREILSGLEKICARLPETEQATQFGNPVWKAGKKTFVCSQYYTGRLGLQFWVGIEQQSMYTMDARYSIPPYMGNKGWIDLDVEDDVDWHEVESLVMNSYRHFALKRMLKVLD